MKILITGGAGFIGKWLVEKLPRQTQIVIVDSLDPQIHKDTQHFPRELKSRATCIKADVCDTTKYFKALERVDVIVHLAAQTGNGQSMAEISRYVRQNVDGTARLLELITSLKRKPRKIILASSRAVYGEGAYRDGKEILYPEGRHLNDLLSGKWELYNNSGRELKPLPMKENLIPKPISVYGFTKLWQEQLIENYAHYHKIDYIIYRFQNVYGPKQELHNPYAGIINFFANAIRQDGIIELFEDGRMTRDYVYVEDVAEAVVKGIFHRRPIANTINVGTGESVSLLNLVDLIAASAGKTPKVKISGRFRIGDIRHAFADMKQYQTILGDWSPTPLKNGIENYLNWDSTKTASSINLLSNSLKEMTRRGVLLTSK